MTRVFDCFMFFDEFDVLALRFAELGDVVDRFVLVEASTTHSGEPKDVQFADRADEFAHIADRLTVVRLTELPSFRNRWIAEQTQRNGVIQGLDDAEPDDLVLVSDCDEIPAATAIRRLPELLPEPGDVVALSMASYYYALNLRADEWFDVAPRAGAHSTSCLRRSCGPRTSRPACPTVGGTSPLCPRTAERSERIARKARSFAHSEFDDARLTSAEQLDEVLANDELWWTGDGPGGARLLHRVPIDASFPEAVRTDPERWRDFVVDGAGERSYELRYQWRRLRSEARRGGYFLRRSLRRR